MGGLRVRVQSPDSDEAVQLSLLERKDRRQRSPTTEVSPFLKRITHEAKLRWTLLSPYSRVAVGCCLMLLVLFVFCGLSDLFFYSYGGNNFTIVSKVNKFAVVINTYKRPKMLKEAVQHYAERCGKRAGVEQVYVIWAELDVTPPETFFDSKVRKRHRDNRSSVQVVRVEKDSLNSRFMPIQGLSTKSIFMVDDDVRVDCNSLFQAFTAWRSHPDSMVGFYPRLSIPPRSSSLSSLSVVGGSGGAEEEKYVYHSWPIVYLRQQMNFILTKACFLHARYMDLYSSDAHPQAIKDYVDKYFNCEDVAMSLLVANVTRSTQNKQSFGGRPAMPIYVEGGVSDKGLFGGISTGSGHMGQRSKCLTDLTRIYREHGWDYPLEQVFDFKDASWVRHSPGFWWQFRPSNFFEWFALENVFE